MKFQAAFTTWDESVGIPEKSVIVVESLEELLTLCAKFHCPILIDGRDKYEFPTLEFYNDYRE